MPLPPVPRKQHIREAVIAKARERQDYRIAEQRRQPALAGRQAPDCDHHVGADDEAAGLVGRVQAAADVVERGAEGGERLRFEIDVLEGDITRAHGGEQLVALPIDPGIADGTAGVVPDNKAMSRHGRSVDRRAGVAPKERSGVARKVRP
jgi:hypothetical protein